MLLNKETWKWIAALRALEVLVIISYDDDMEDSEWHNTENLHVCGIDYDTTSEKV